ncbi:SDR family NAD(P)-dependent oxidoreductase [Paenibacillus athensensis]|uniref:Oxidoreductase n=1 Tax=Paenibacillus athensensis TaxID=1967502 RepID=A0A4Y8QA68_9BACL|nr:SDR family NAD(P)-dependent oxidoreductase [Paenibacillus athensensis]
MNHDPYVSPDLQGTVALVTGSSRGGGRGIARVLGQAGATVYITGRSSRAHGATDDWGTIEQTAEEVAARGGIGIPVRCDHTDDAAVAALYERIGREQNGRLDLVVNNAWGGYENYFDAPFQAVFWEQPMTRWDGMFTAGLRAQMLSSRAAMKLLLPQKSGLIINTGVFIDLGGGYHGNVFYDTVKRAVVHMTYGMAQNLSAADAGVTALALAPGWMRTEAVCSAFNVSQEGDDWTKVADLATTESVEYIGRAIAALAADPAVGRWAGQLLEAGDAAREYGFTDTDGRLVPPFRIT